MQEILQSSRSTASPGCRSANAGLWLLGLLLFLGLAPMSVLAQPTVLGTQIVSGGYVTYNLATVGAFKQVRLQASSGAASGTRNWEFARGTAGSTDYSTNWRPYGSGLTLAGYNQVIAPVGGTASALYNTGFGGNSGLLPAVTSGNYYTFNITNNATSNNTMAVLETTFNPVAISSVAQSPAAGSVTYGAPVTVTATLSTTPSASEYFYLRYSADNFSSSTVAAMTVSTNTAEATIPNLASTSGAQPTVRYYVFSSSSATAPTPADADMMTLSINNNNNSNYSYTYPAPVTFTSVSTPSSPGCGSNVITATLSGTPGAGEYIYLRYNVNPGTTRGTFANGNPILAMTGSGNTVTATIPAQPGSTVTYYAFSSTSSTAAGTNDGTNAINYGSNGGNNYSYSQQALPTFTTTQNNGCFNQSDASITVTAANGTGAYQYSKDGGTTWQSSNVFSNLGDGTYSIVVRNSTGAQCAAAAQSVIITQPSAALVGTFTPTNATCSNGTDGSITVSASGGTSPYTYTVNNASNGNPAGTFNSGTNSFTGLAPGDYTVVVTDNNGCSEFDIVTVGSTNPAPTATPSNNGPLCTGTQAQLTIAFTGTGPWTITFNDGSQGPNPGSVSNPYVINTGTIPGFTNPYTFNTPTPITTTTTYTVTALTDNGTGCSATTTLPVATTVVVNNYPTFTTTATPINCAGQNTGSIAVSASGGTGSYQYALSGGPAGFTPIGYQSGSVFNSLRAGTYDVQVRNSTGALCAAAAQSVTVSEPASAVAISTTPTPATCAAGNDGKILAEGSGGTGPYQYTITGGTSYFPMVATNGSYEFTGLTAGNNYTVQVRDANGCTASTAVTLGFVNPRPTATLSNSGPVCAGSMAVITVTFTAGTQPFSFTYTDGSGSSTTVNGVTTSSTTFTTPALAGNTTYSLTALQDAYCTATALPSTSVTVNATTNWLGTAPGDANNWFNAANWDNCIPNAFLSAAIPGGKANYPILTGTATVKTLNINSGATLTQGVASTLSVYGDLVNSGIANFVYDNDANGVYEGGILRFEGTENHTISGVAQVYDLTIAKGSTATIVLAGNNLQVRNSLTMSSGILNTGAFTLGLSSDLVNAFGVDNATISETNTSYVLGRVSTTSFVDDNLAGNPGYRNDFGGLGLTLTPTVGTDAPGNTTVLRTTGTRPVGTAGNQGISRTFRVTPANTVDVLVAIAFDYFNHELAGINATQLSLFSKSLTASATGPWSYYSNSSNSGAGATGGRVSFSGLTTNLASEFALASLSAPLPVELTRFEAKRSGSHAELLWQTASEKSNAGFEVQVSTDGREFRTIHFVVPASSNSSSPRSYSYTDREAGKQGLRYYRLRQLDSDKQAGHSSISPVRTVAFGEATGTQLSAAPNPFNQYLTLTVQAQQANTAAQLLLTDMNGRTVLEQLVSLPAGISQLELKQLDKLPAGLYLLQLPLDGRVQHLKVVKQ